MQKNAVILLIVLLCVAFLVSCGKKQTAEANQGELVRIETEGNFPSVFICVPSMVLILLVKVQSRVFTAKCSEPQVGASNGMDEGSGVAKFLSLRTET